MQDEDVAEKRRVADSEAAAHRVAGAQRLPNAVMVDDERFRALVDAAHVFLGTGSRWPVTTHEAERLAREFQAVELEARRLQHAADSQIVLSNARQLKEAQRMADDYLRRFKEACDELSRLRAMVPPPVRTLLWSNDLFEVVHVEQYPDSRVQLLTIGDDSESGETFATSTLSPDDVTKLVSALLPYRAARHASHAPPSAQLRLAWRGGDFVLEQTIDGVVTMSTARDATDHPEHEVRSVITRDQGRALLSTLQLMLEQDRDPRAAQ